MSFRRIDDRISVAGQITPDEVAEAARQGFVAIINNRPEGEQPGQPEGAEIAAAAEAAGMSYDAIPVGHDGFGTVQIDAMRAALDRADGPVLAFCRSGTRSTFLWALARAGAEDGAALREKAAQAGYDLSPIAHVLP